MGHAGLFVHPAVAVELIFLVQQKLLELAALIPLKYWSPIFLKFLRDVVAFGGIVHDIP